VRPGTRRSSVSGWRRVDLVLGPVRRRSALELQARTRAGLGRLREALSSDRYYRLLDSLDDLAAVPPLTPRADRPDAAALPRLVGRQVRRVRRAADAVPADDGAARDTALHEVRKAAKRARYAAESAAPVIGKPAQRLASRMEELQELLGEHQDAVTARALHRELGAAAYAAGENGFTFGILQAEEDAVVRNVSSRYARVLERATGKKATGWTGS
jgi:CHAD domain-containing protein